jgi:predicted DNA-binding WGR domain protein
MVDTAEHYATRDVLERYVSRPRILGAFGWRTLQVLARDWHHDRNAVLEAIERALREPEVAQANEADADVVRPAAMADAPRIGHEAAAPDVPNLGASSAQHAPPRDAAELPWRRLEFVEGTSRKFWQIRREGPDVVIAFGRIGTTGQSQRKQFADAGHAQAEIEKLVAEKLRKGYLDT